MQRAPITELKAKLSHYLDQVRTFDDRLKQAARLEGFDTP